MTASVRRRRSARVDRYLVNPAMRRLIAWGWFPSVYALIETTGRRTSRPRVTPVGHGRDGDTVWIVAEDGRTAGYVHNLRADPTVRVRIARRWRTGTATLLPDDAALTRRAAMDAANGLMGRLDGAIFTRKATDPLTIRIDLDPQVPKA